MKKKVIKIYCDGGARGNPGPAASAFAVIENSKVIYKESKYIGETTNNVAEYQSVLLAVSWISKSSVYSSYDEINIFLDSQLVEKQLNGKYKVKNQGLRKYFDETKKLLQGISATITFESLPREKNKLADLLVNEELDNQK